MKLAKLSLLFTAAAVSLLPALAETVTEPAGTPADRISALEKQVADAWTAYSATNDPSGGLWAAYYHLNDTNLPKIFELAKRDPAAETSFDAFSWILTNRRIAVRALQPYGTEALKFLRDYHTARPNIGEICRKLGNYWDPMDPAAMEFLQAASEKNPDRQSRGFATLALGQLLKQQMETRQMFALLPPSTNRWWVEENAKYQAASRQANEPALFNQAAATLEKVQRDYGDCTNLPSHGIRNPRATLGEEAAIDLFELNHLTIGREAPEAAGKDLEGRDLKLSQFRGKVVLLTFWASWCGPCMQMVPLERSLAERYKSQPFALLGVNGDGRKEDARKAVRSEEMTWPSIWDDGGPNGSIPEAWNVRGWPTYYVFDAQGVVRFKGLGYGGNNTSNALTAVIDRLLKDTTDKKTE